MIFASCTNSYFVVRDKTWHVAEFSENRNLLHEAEQNLKTAPITFYTQAASTKDQRNSNVILSFRSDLSPVNFTRPTLQRRQSSLHSFARFIKAFLCRRGMTLTEASSGFENCPVKYHNRPRCHSYIGKKCRETALPKTNLGSIYSLLPGFALHCQIYLWRLLFWNEMHVTRRSAFGRSIKTLYE